MGPGRRLPTEVMPSAIYWQTRAEIQSDAFELLLGESVSVCTTKALSKFVGDMGLLEPFRFAVVHDAYRLGPTNVTRCIELGELMCFDALDRNESCGGHFREEYQTEEGEALRDDENYMYVSAWEHKGPEEWELHKEELIYENIKIAQRSYK